MDEECTLWQRGLIDALGRRFPPGDFLTRALIAKFLIGDNKDALRDYMPWLSKEDEEVSTPGTRRFGSTSPSQEEAYRKVLEREAKVNANKKRGNSRRSSKDLRG